LPEWWYKEEVDLPEAKQRKMATRSSLERTVSQADRGSAKCMHSKTNPLVKRFAAANPTKNL
jgi:hypothetical protein